MREVQSFEAKTHFAQLLDEVERGEGIVITRNGKPIARLVPEAERRREQWAMAKAETEELRKTMPRLSLDEILSARHEGHKY